MADVRAMVREHFGASSCSHGRHKAGAAQSRSSSRSGPPSCPRASIGGCLRQAARWRPAARGDDQLAADGEPDARRLPRRAEHAAVAQPRRPLPRLGAVRLRDGRLVAAARDQHHPNINQLELDYDAHHMPWTRLAQGRAARAPPQQGGRGAARLPRRRLRHLDALDGLPRGLRLHSRARTSGRALLWARRPARQADARAAAHARRRRVRRAGRDPASTPATSAGRASRLLALGALGQRGVLRAGGRPHDGAARAPGLHGRSPRSTPPRRRCSWSRPSAAPSCAAWCSRSRRTSPRRSSSCSSRRCRTSRRRASGRRARRARPFKRQAQTSLDYSPSNTLVWFITGGLNLQSIHHLLPSVSCVHYPAMYPKFLAICEKHPSCPPGPPASSTPSPPHWNYVYRLGLGEAQPPPPALGRRVRISPREPRIIPMRSRRRRALGLAASSAAPPSAMVVARRRAVGRPLAARLRLVRGGLHARRGASLRAHRVPSSPRAIRRVSVASSHSERRSPWRELLERDVRRHDQLLQLELARELAHRLEDVLLLARELGLHVADLGLRRLVLRPQLLELATLPLHLFLQRRVLLLQTQPRLLLLLHPLLHLLLARCSASCSAFAASSAARRALLSSRFSPPWTSFACSRSTDARRGSARRARRGPRSPP